MPQGSGNGYYFLGLRFSNNHVNVSPSAPSGLNGMSTLRSSCASRDNGQLSDRGRLVSANPGGISRRASDAGDTEDACLPRCIRPGAVRCLPSATTTLKSHDCSPFLACSNSPWQLMPFTPAIPCNSSSSRRSPYQQHRLSVWDIR